MEVIKQLDETLYGIVQDIDILDAVAPVNYRAEKKHFLESNYASNPDFEYRPHTIDLFQRKRQLYNLDIESLGDEDVARLYIDVIESYADKLDQYKSIGSGDFFYDSLRYYGEPSPKDINNARFVLHLPDEPAIGSEASVDADGIAAALTAFAEQQGYTYQVVIVESMIANALASGTTIKVNRAARIPQLELNALAHHELGVHLVTTLNGRAQPLRVLSLGSPVNTTTQEGLAILCEYLSGSLTLSRLKILALRVIAVQSMIQEREFRRTFLLLKEQYQVNDDLAFTITARIYRGGGFTKDYLYLQGFHHMLNAYERYPNFKHLLAGKVSLAHLDTVSRLIEKGVLIEPGFISPAIASPETLSDVHRFVAHAIK